jgi:CDP-diacylglycerol--serine O-phosphatidyltransferase
MKMRLNPARKKKAFAALPTLLTLGNAVCGFGAITFAAKWTGYDTPTSILAAGALIYLAMVFDALDGAAARWTRQTSEFGAQLDSLCDAISFGAAPAFLMLALARPLGYHPRVLWVVAALYVTCTVLRLARFNVQIDAAADPSRPKAFTGLPSPAAAAVLASFPVMLYGPQVVTGDDGGSEWVVGLVAQAVPLVTVAVACLMVSRAKYPHLVRQLVRGRRSGRFTIKVVFAVAVVVAVPRVAAPLLACWYAFATPVMELWTRQTRRPDPAAPPQVPDGGRWPRPAPTPPHSGDPANGAT